MLRGQPRIQRLKLRLAPRSVLAPSFHVSAHARRDWPPNNAPERRWLLFGLLKPRFQRLDIGGARRERITQFQEPRLQSVFTLLAFGLKRREMRVEIGFLRARQRFRGAPIFRLQSPLVFGLLAGGLLPARSPPPSAPRTPAFPPRSFPTRPGAAAGLFKTFRRGFLRLLPGGGRKHALLFLRARRVDGGRPRVPPA